MLDGFPGQQPVLQTPLLTIFVGNDTSRKVSFSPPSNRQMVVFNTLARILGCFNLHPEAWDEVEDVRDIQHTPQSLYGTKKGV
ncbi:hypothetical protein TNIN_147801 [Trichonephila inaurata madagascariensis]|uniref:Uncharacterized protein n=1 Tax=Trichonephila inaurata madagascariensis TaxID=2747483 RepID=A0A8X6XAW6_9ARAC|nr:hypothetical protein TNIN_147801 [Trichonephila inaurata madagascariensis]